jgi:hypothetical protein
MTVELRVWTIYFNAADHPGLFVTRGWTVSGAGPGPDQTCLVFESLTAARSAVPADKFCVGRQEGDDPCIVETWV